MAEVAVVGGAPPDAAADLSARVAALGGRIADVLSGDDGGEPALSFLRQMQEDVGRGPAPGWRSAPLDRLARRLGLSAFEIDLVLLAGMPEEHQGYASVFRALHPQGEPRPSAGLAVRLFCDGPGERRFAADAFEHGAAVRAGVLALPPGPPLHERTLVVGEALWPALRGLDRWPASMTPVLEVPCARGLEDWLATDEVSRAVAALRADVPVTLIVIADQPATAAHRAAVLAEAAGRRTACVRPRDGTLPTDLFLSHCALRDAVPVVEVGDREDGRPEALPDLDTFAGTVVLCTGRRASAPTRERSVIALDVTRPSAGERRTIWQASLPELGHRAHLLAARYSLEPYQVRAVCNDARTLAKLEGRDVDESHVADGVRLRCGAPAWSGLDRVHPVAGWDDLVLSARQMEPLREAVGRILHQTTVLDDWGFLRRRRGAAGVRMLFTGPPGTGKTLSAEVMARELGVDLLVVDVSRVVSKWIGETEKNLARVFDAAEEGQAVLLFDECDALFGRRTDVSDAHDRYANLETAFLLSRIERFEGLTILSSNLRENIDPAFMRRLEFIVGYEVPGLAEREALWRCHVPSEAPLEDDVDFGELAALYPIVGGLIRNAAVAAAFLAACAGTRIAMAHLVHAVRREYEKSGRAFPGVPRSLKKRIEHT